MDRIKTYTSRISTHGVSHAFEVLDRLSADLGKVEIRDVQDHFIDGSNKGYATDRVIVRTIVYRSVKEPTKLDEIRRILEK